MDEIEEADDDIDIHTLVFIGSNKEKFNFNTFRISLNFLSAIYNGKISFKKAEINQRDLKQKIQELKYNYNQNITKKEKRKRRNKWSTDAGK